MKFFESSTIDNQMVLINVEKIAMIMCAEGDATVVFFDDGSQTTVKERYEIVKRIMREHN